MLFKRINNNSLLTWNF